MSDAAEADTERPAPPERPQQAPEPAAEPREQRAGAPGNGRGRQRGGGRRGQQSSRRNGGGNSRGPALVVRYGLMRQLGLFRCSFDPLPGPREQVVVRTERGVEQIGRAHV